MTSLLDLNLRRRGEAIRSMTLKLLRMPPTTSSQRHLCILSRRRCRCHRSMAFRRPSNSSPWCLREMPGRPLRTFQTRPLEFMKAAVRSLKIPPTTLTHRPRFLSRHRTRRTTSRKASPSRQGCRRASGRRKADDLDAGQGSVVQIRAQPQHTPASVALFGPALPTGTHWIYSYYLV